MSTRGLSDDDYLSYFWSECPQYQDHQADIEFIYQDLYQVVVKQAAKKASSKATAKSKEAK
jgi:exodeoxyribonuclease V gamma subunit